jgi:hypothetical protein
METNARERRGLIPTYQSLARGIHPACHPSANPSLVRPSVDRCVEAVGTAEGDF